MCGIERALTRIDPRVKSAGPSRSWKRSSPRKSAMWTGKNGGFTIPESTSCKGPSVLGGSVTSSTAPGVAHRREERQAQDVVVVQVGEQGGGPQRAAGRLQRSRSQVVAEGAQSRPQIEDQGRLPVHLDQHA